MLVIGIDIGGTKVALGASIDVGQPMLVDSDVFQMEGKSYEQIKRAIIAIVQKWVEEWGYPSYISLGLPGTLDDELTHVVKAPNAKALEGQPFRADLEATFGCPVYLGGDVEASAAAEGLYGVGVDDSKAELIFASIGTGFGVGVVLNCSGRRVARATQYGHTTVVPDGATCGCGGKGCAEAYVTGWGMVRHFNLKSLDDIPGMLWHDEQEQIGKYVGMAAQAAILGAPSVKHLVLGGTVIVEQDWILDFTRNWLEANLSIVPVPAMSLSRFGASAGVVGCIAMAEMVRREGGLGILGTPTVFQ